MEFSFVFFGNSFSDISDELAALGEEIGVIIKCQREDIFDKMHRI